MENLSFALVDVKKNASVLTTHITCQSLAIKPFSAKGIPCVYLQQKICVTHYYWTLNNKVKGVFFFLCFVSSVFLLLFTCRLPTFAIRSLFCLHRKTTSGYKYRLLTYVALLSSYVIHDIHHLCSRVSVDKKDEK